MYPLLTPPPHRRGVVVRRLPLRGPLSRADGGRGDPRRPDRRRPDYARWPKAPNSTSLYWEGLNKGKKSVANFPVAGFLAHETLAQRRADLVTVRIMGQADGGPALDYTVNATLGIPQITGPASLGDAPVNHVLPAWDLLTGAYAAYALLAAERHRRETGQGQEVRIPLADVGIATIANLGMLAEVLGADANRERLGNDIYGAFGRDFVARDGARLMLMAITPRQWTGLVNVLELNDAVARIEAARNVSFARDEGVRFAHRDALYPLVEAAVATRDAAPLAAALDANGCCWGPYRTMREAADDPALVTANPVFGRAAQPSGANYPVPGAMATIPRLDRRPPVRAPRLGEHSNTVLAELLGLSDGQIGALHDKGVVAQPDLQRTVARRITSSRSG